MSMTMENLLSDEDYLLIEANMLGAPLSVYKLKPSYIRFIRVKSNDQSGLFITALLPALYAILKGGVFYRFDVKRARSARIIICEQGLLHIARKIKSDLVEVVRWKDVLEVKKEFIGKAYYFTRRNGMSITLSSSYQDLDKLVAVIRERSGKEE